MRRFHWPSGASCKAASGVLAVLALFGRVFAMYFDFAGFIWYKTRLFLQAHRSCFHSRGHSLYFFNAKLTVYI